MSFVSILKTIGRDAQKVAGIGLSIASTAAPFVAMTPVGPIFNTILNLAWTVEEAIPQPGQGGIKKDAVMAAVNALHPGLNQQQLSSAVDAAVALYNGIAGAVSTPAAPTPVPPTPPGQPA